MSFFIEYIKFPDTIKQVKMELGETWKYQTIGISEKITQKENVPLVTDTKEDKKEYEFTFKVVDEYAKTSTIHTMSREELNEYINILRAMVTQAK